MDEWGADALAQLPVALPTAVSAPPPAVADVDDPSAAVDDLFSLLPVSPVLPALVTPWDDSWLVEEVLASCLLLDFLLSRLFFAFTAFAASTTTVLDQMFSTFGEGMVASTGMWENGEILYGINTGENPTSFLLS